MAIKDLAVAFNGSENAQSALKFAIQMCKKYKAALTGLHMRMPPEFEQDVSRWISREIMDTLAKAGAEEAAGIEAGFRETVTKTEFSGSVDWVVEEGPPNDLLARAARYYDVLLMGQFSSADDKRPRVRAEDLVLRSGRPIIIVPNQYTVRPFNEYAVIAWDGSRAAASALSNAMLILETKTRLDVVTVMSDEDAQSKKGAPPSNDIMRHLKRHGIEAEQVTLSAPRGGHGPAITGYCADVNPDVLVMGGYGHARLREELFGGVTQHVMQHMNVPVFMSH